MFRVKVVTQPDRSRQEAIKARIKERRKIERNIESTTHKSEKNNVDS